MAKMVSHLTNKSNIIILPPFPSFFRALKHYVWLESSAWFTPSGLIHRQEGLALKCLLWKHFRQWFWKLSFDNFTPWFLPAICEASWYPPSSDCERTQTLAPSSGPGPTWGQKVLKIIFSSRKHSCQKARSKKGTGSSALIYQYTAVLLYW